MNYHEEEAEKGKRLSGITADTAKFLGAPWQVVPQRDPQYPTHKLSNGDGAELYFRIEYNHVDRVSISGSLNIGLNGQHETVYENGNRAQVPDITVALSRGPEAVAKEIQRRLLPEYLRILALAKAQVKRHMEQVTMRIRHLSKLATVAGQVLDFSREPERDRFYLQGRSGTINVHYDGRVSMERLDVTMEEAEYILRHLYRKVESA